MTIILNFEDSSLEIKLMILIYKIFTDKGLYGQSLKISEILITLINILYCIIRVQIANILN